MAKKVSKKEELHESKAEFPRYLPTKVVRKLHALSKRVQDHTEQLSKIQDDANRELDVFNQQLEEHWMSNWNLYGQHPDTVEVKDREEVEFKQARVILKARERRMKELQEELESSLPFIKRKMWVEVTERYKENAASAYSCLPSEINWNTGEITKNTTDEKVPDELDLDLDELEKKFEEKLSRSILN